MDWVLDELEKLQPWQIPKRHGPPPSVWERERDGFSWQARPAFFSVFWRSKW